ncbi:MAG TPA: CsbD family protein [Pseudomonas sabulinigri]|uniref:CsbD-like domain-containing protein n=1 Tax=marine sediment metagenome TaxID=412755 RepID=A0A0F9VGB3_9ZZZZ|nr:CsbD family protein [Halopseudomonas sabulinigri]HEC51580.1 CsbD family protein [Halopseudomonas sabulinigri]
MTSTTDKIKGKYNETVGEAKSDIGKATDNEELQGEGELQKIKGKGETAKGNVKDKLKDLVDKA